MELINPCGVYRRIDTPLATRKPLSEVKCVGLFSNRKHNADLFLNEVAKRLKQHHPHLEFEVFKKFASSPANFSDKWMSMVNTVVAAFGD